MWSRAKRRGHLTMTKLRFINSNQGSTEEGEGEEEGAEEEGEILIMIIIIKKKQ